MDRREFLAVSAGAAVSAGSAPAQIAGERPGQDPTVTVVNPRNRVPVSLIIDDSTCLVNLNRFAIPQFRAAYGGKRYFQNWRAMPYEIPDSFVRKFGEWCAAAGVKGKYSIVPYPACVGRLDRELPGWSKQQLADSIRLVRELMTPNWDIHPEMVTHTRIIDTRTGHPFPERSQRYMENCCWSDNRSTDELAAYMRYALNILRNIELPCEGVTTPGGFGSGALPQLAQATLEACREVYQAEVPHYFRHLYSAGSESVAPRVEYASGLAGRDPQAVVSIIGCTGDWTGGWDSSFDGDPDLFITADLSAGRMVEVIDRGEPACMVAHWTGIHWNGLEKGFKIFRQVVERLNAKYDDLIWMKLSEIARYWAARELTSIRRNGAEIALNAPFACPGFTVRFARPGPAAPRLGDRPLTPVGEKAALEPGRWFADGDSLLACFDLPKGASTLTV